MIAQSKPNRATFAASLALAGASLSGCVHEHGPRDRYFESRRDIAPSWVNPDLEHLTMPEEHPIHARAIMPRNIK